MILEEDESAENDGANQPMTRKTKATRRTRQKAIDILSQVMDLESQTCLYKTTHLTLTSNFTGNILDQIAKALSKIAGNILGIDDHQCDEYKFNIVLLFNFFPIFLTGNSFRTQEEDIIENLRRYNSKYKNS